MINQLRNSNSYWITTVLYAFSSMYFFGSLNVDFHWLTLTYGSYIDQMALVTSLFFVSIGSCLFLGALAVTQQQIHIDQQQSSLSPLQILGLELVALLLVGIDLSYLQILSNSILAEIFIVLGFLFSILRFYRNQKLFRTSK